MESLLTEHGLADLIPRQFSIAELRCLNRQDLLKEYGKPKGFLVFNRIQKLLKETPNDLELSLEEKAIGTQHCAAQPATEKQAQIKQLPILTTQNKPLRRSHQLIKQKQDSGAQQIKNLACTVSTSRVNEGKLELPEPVPKSGYATMCSTQEYQRRKCLKYGFNKYERFPVSYLATYPCPHRRLDIDSTELTSPTCVIPVKQYLRSVGGDSSVEGLVRPVHVLSRCVDHLLTCVLNYHYHAFVSSRSIRSHREGDTQHPNPAFDEKEDHFETLFGFLSDRFRAIKQDLVVQRADTTQPGLTRTILLKGLKLMTGCRALLSGHELRYQNRVMLVDVLAMLQSPALALAVPRVTPQHEHEHDLVKGLALLLTAAHSGDAQAILRAQLCASGSMTSSPLFLLCRDAWLDSHTHNPTAYARHLHLSLSLSPLISLFLFTEQPLLLLEHLKILNSTYLPKGHFPLKHLARCWGLTGSHGVRLTEELCTFAQLPIRQPGTAAAAVKLKSGQAWHQPTREELDQFHSSFIKRLKKYLWTQNTHDSSMRDRWLILQTKLNMVFEQWSHDEHEDVDVDNAKESEADIDTGLELGSSHSMFSWLVAL